MQEQMRANLAMRLALPAVVVALATMLCLMVGVDSAYAGGARDISELKGNTTAVKMQKRQTIAFGDMKAGKKITSVKSSNKKVATVKVMKGQSGPTYIMITMKKVGTTKISYKLGGKKKTAVLKVVKWKNPVKSFKIGSTNYASKFKKAVNFTESIDLSAKRVAVKAARGWKVVKILYYAGGDMPKKIKNGTTLPNGTSFVSVVLKNKKTKAVENVVVSYYPESLSAA